MSDAGKIASLEFKSPLSMEGSWGSNRIADNASSTMDLYLYKDNTGFIEWCCDELDLCEHIGLTFEINPRDRTKWTLTDYDGVMTLPDQAMDLLEREGFDCQEMRKSLA